MQHCRRYCYFCSMGWKDTKLYSILGMKCPKCHNGDLFKERNTYKLSTLTQMHASCPNCKENFEREPGFYFGAAYVSYGLTVALWVACLVALMTFDAIGLIEFSFFTHPLTFILTGIISLIVLLPPIYRLSRSIWINLFVQYEKGASELADES